MNILRTWIAPYTNPNLARAARLTEMALRHNRLVTT